MTLTELLEPYLLHHRTFWVSQSSKPHPQPVKRPSGRTETLRDSHMNPFYGNGLSEFICIAPKQIQAFQIIGCQFEHEILRQIFANERFRKPALAAALILTISSRCPSPKRQEPAKARAFSSVMKRAGPDQSAKIIARPVISVHSLPRSKT